MGLFSDFTGSQSRSDLTGAYNKANTDVATGYNAQQGYYGQAAGNFQPWIDSGTAANKMLSGAMGLDGDAARTSAESTITSDPLFTGALNLANGNTQAYMNSRGSGSGGAFVQAAQNNLYQNYNSVLDRYSDMSKTGLGAAGSQAGVYTGEGDNAFNYGTTKAGNDIQYGNGMAQTRNMGINNLTSLIAAGAGTVNAMRGTPSNAMFRSN